MPKFGSVPARPLAAALTARLIRSLARTARFLAAGAGDRAADAAAVDPCPFVDTQAVWKDMADDDPAAALSGRPTPQPDPYTGRASRLANVR